MLGNIGAAVDENRDFSHRETAVNLYNGACDIRCRVGKQKRRDRRDVFHRTEAPQRNQVERGSPILRW